MDTLAVVLNEPGDLKLRRLHLSPPAETDVVVDIAWSGISTGTERLLWSGRMPSFPGMGYPLVPGYESVGRLVEAGPQSGRRTGEQVFVAGANCFPGFRGLFGGAAARVVLPGRRAAPIDPGLGESGILLALAATAHHAVSQERPPQLIVGHGVLGRLLARITIAQGAPPPAVWDQDPVRRGSATEYNVIDPESDPRRDYATIYDASGDPGILDTLIGRLASGGEITLTGFYAERLAFSYPPAFSREARIRAAAEWRTHDLEAVLELVDSGRLSLDGLITHRSAASNAEAAYRTAFENPSCLKMILDWRISS